MLDLKDLQAMAKNSEISEQLLSDQAFKSEFKKIVKEEARIDITDEQIPEIIKKFENTLQDEKVLKEAELDDILGGAPKTTITRKDVQKISRGHLLMKLGVILVSCAAGVVGEKVLFNTVVDKNVKLDSTKEKAAYVGMRAATGLGILTASETIGDFVMEKLYRKHVKKKYGMTLEWR